MSKYDFSLDLETNNTMKIINDSISSNTDVLEFGCACGRLTKHLKNNKNCRVTIVEIDKEAGDEASKYAIDSFTGNIDGDIEKYIWAENINSKFDYIIFADVLEHLYNPQKVLKRCKDFLKENGSILVSVPNIAHNSIIIDLINSKFDYQKTGLLDDTHIKFFTYESFKRMLDEINLVKYKEFATYSKVGENEFNNSYDDVSKYIKKEINKRPKGNVYQYVYEIKQENPLRDIKTENNIADYEFCDYFFSVFLTETQGEVFGDKNLIRERYIPQENKKNQFEFNLNEKRYVKKLRIDPIECNCVIKINNIIGCCEEKRFNIDIESSNSNLRIKNIYFFETSDPQLFSVEINKEIEKIIIDFELIEYETFNKIKYDILSDELREEQNIILQKEDYIQEQRKRLEERRIIIEQKENYINEQRKELDERRIIIEQKENYINEQRNELNRIKNSKYYKMYAKAKRILGRKS